MFKSSIKEVAGLSVIAGEPEILGLFQTLEGMTVEEYKIINVAKIRLPIQINTYRSEVDFWHTTRSEVAYKLVDKCADTKAVVNQFDALNLFGSTKGVASQGWNYKKQCDELYLELSTQLGIVLSAEQQELLGRLIKEAAAYCTQALIEKDITKLTYQCEDLNDGVVLKKYHELDDYEVIWGAFTESRISNVFKDSATRNNAKYAAALTQQSLDGIYEQLTQIQNNAPAAREDYTRASEALGLAIQKHEAHTNLLNQPTTNKNSMSMQRASLAVGMSYIDAKVWKDRAAAAIKIDKNFYKRLNKYREARERFLATLSRRKAV